MRKIWRLLAKTLGEKSGATDSESDAIALIRLAIISQAFITNMAIIAGIVRHWSN